LYVSGPIEQVIVHYGAKSLACDKLQLIDRVGPGVIEEQWPVGPQNPKVGSKIQRKSGVHSSPCVAEPS